MDHKWYVSFKTTMWCIVLTLWLVLSTHNSLAQEISGYKIHSHNDYEQNIPFWNAYGNGLNSIEIDVFLVNDKLFVAHHKDEIQKQRTIESLYLEPIRNALELKLGSQQPLQILIDIKTEATPTLILLVDILNGYPDLINSEQITFVISGNRPAPERYADYPSFIWFDYQSLEDISTDAWNKVALISLPFGRYSNWKGDIDLPEKDYEKIKGIVDQAHSYHKSFRFWGTPDEPLAWETFVDLGIDFINTDKPYACSQYLADIKR